MEKRKICGLYVIPYTGQFLSCQMEEYEYLSDEFMDMMKMFVEEAEKRGIALWLYDEAGWPSGSANGTIVRDYPELAQYALDKSRKKRPIPPAAQPYPDLLNKRTAPLFITYTHEKYKKAFGDLQKHFSLIFTDEPAVRTMDPNTVFWTDGLEDIFQEAFGYDIMEHFELLFADAPCTEMARRVKADYHDLLGRLLAENYFAPIRSFCHENGVLATGHLGGDDVAFGNAKWGYHQLLRCLRSLDVPAIDVIWRQIFPGEKSKGIEPYAPLCANTLFPRYASSAAHQIGARFAMSESYAIYSTSLTYSQMRWIYNFQVVRGINMLNPMSIRFAYEGRQYIGAAPKFTPLDPGATDLAEFNLWAARVNYIMSAGKPISETALYIPLRDIWVGDALGREMAEGFEQAGAALESYGCDIDVIDDDAILAGDIADGCLVIGDARYKSIYIQTNATLTDAVRHKLDLFAAAGGHCVACSDDSRLGQIICASNKSFRATRREINEGRLYYITSEAFFATVGEIAFPLETSDTAYEINAATGERKVVSAAPYRSEFALGEERILLFPNRKISEAPEICPLKKRTLVLENFEIRRLRSVEPTAQRLCETQLLEPYTPIALGDWRDTVGAFFSGDCLYKTTFKATDEMKEGTLLELGKVGYSCEVFLNGRSIGIGIFEPFTFSLPQLLDENELLIRVSNTLSNAYQNIRFTDWFPNYETGFLYNIQKSFEGDSLPSGLFGPVVIKY